jgi:hypothetical protein
MNIRKKIIYLKGGKLTLLTALKVRIKHYLDNRLIDGDWVVSLTRWQPFTSTNIFRYLFLLATE